eukprot:TRINITY_DN8256_c1_g1_i1.p2 TRINITY_DN8256_c1_g1~~TRINITY_DN8256_c1_g1_i1.p2  ORF type:complete len:147 (-),score=41.05 TRINITY_DN8256_c1_g1_i1:32-472(-)
MGNQACCSKEDVEQHEAVESKAIRSAPEVPVVEEKLPEQKPAHPAEPAVTALSTSQPRNGEFEVTLDKTDGTRLGCDVDHEDGKTLVVDAITGSGLITEWNEANPDKALKPGDRIVEVNGHRGDVLRLVDECKQCKVLKILVQRDK